MKKSISFFHKFHVARRSFYFLLIVSITLLAVFLTDFWLSKFIEKEIKTRVELLNGKINAIKVTLFTRTLRVESLEWASTSEDKNLRQHSLRIKTLTARGISLYELFANKTISFDKVTIDSGKFQFDRSSKSIFPKTGNFDAPIFKFKSIVLASIETQVTLDSAVSFSAILNCNLKDVYIEKNSTTAIQYSGTSAVGSVEKISISRHEGMYGMTIASLAFNTETKQITVDSTLVIPNFEKFKFAQQEGRQIGRLNLSVPRISVSGMDFNKLADTAWIASKIEIASFDLYSFKDKRVTYFPVYRELPMETFLKLPYFIKVDTIVIHKSHINVEEFPENGIEPGTVTFDELTATITGLNNRIKDEDPKHATLKATALLMNSGRINATFLFPLDGSATYQAEGTVSKMSFDKLNPILKSAADVEVESGYMNNLIFNFSYTDRVSRGKLEVDYEDLHILVLDKNKSTTNEFKTLLVNAFVKTNMNKDKSPVHKTAEINIERDRNRFIFNVWTKSVLDGLKNSMLKNFANQGNQKKAEARRNKK